MPRRLAASAALLLLGACGAPIPSFSPMPAPVPQGQRDSRYEACREQATRVVQYRERGQLMRSDETESGRGTLTVAPYSRVEADRGAAQIDRDRLIAECLRASPTPVRGPGATAAPAAEAPPATTLRLPPSGRALPPPSGTR
jgi:hypothetical protein